MKANTGKKVWNTQKTRRLTKLNAAKAKGLDKLVPNDRAIELLETVIVCEDKVCIEGNNQKQADFLSECLSQCNPEVLNDLHILQSVLALPSHIDIFEKGIASKVDFSFSGPQALRLANLVQQQKIHIGSIHTYLELYGRYFIDLTPNVCLITAHSADANGNLYTGPNTEDTPAIVEATAFKSGIVIAQVNELVDNVPRVDIPADWVDFFIVAPKPNYIEPLFTRDPAQITDVQILMAMMVIKGIYAPYQIKRLNHGIGFNTAAIELLLPTYGEELNLKGKICTNWALNPHPTMIPAIESGFVESIHSFGSEVGMDDYIKERPDVFFTGSDGNMRSNRAFSQTAGLYACDLFIGSTLQIDLQGNSSTATVDRIAGFGGAPNMGSDPHGRRHSSYGYLKAGKEATDGRVIKGRKLVVQLVETFRENMNSVFVEELDAWQLQEKMGSDFPPIMIYGEDVTHIVTEEGIANLLLCRTPEEREQAIRGVAGYTSIGMQRDHEKVKELRQRKIIQRPEDLGIDISKANRDLLAAKSVKDLVRWSNGTYAPQVVLETGKNTAKDITMNILNFKFTSQPVDVTMKEVICGVVGSGNLEILVSSLTDSEHSKFVINTSVTGFDHIWEAVIQEFVDRYAVGGLQFDINDMGATPAVVSLRLSQAIDILEGEAHE